MKLAIVTDSTCDWSAEEYTKHEVTVVPLKILVGGETLLDQQELSSEEFYDRMIKAESVPSTSQPSPGDFIKVYSELAARGYEAILSMHLAPVLSGTYQSAKIAAQSSEVPVEVFDSKNATSSLGLLVEAACSLRDADRPLDEIMNTLRELSSCTHLFLAPDNTENLVKGGRITEEQSRGAAMLNIKLVFALDAEGRLNNFDKVKGSKGIIKRFVEIIQSHEAEFGPLRLRCMHARNSGEVDNLIAALDEAGVAYDLRGIDACGATVATHAGIGVIGFGVMPVQAQGYERH